MPPPPMHQPPRHLSRTPAPSMPPASNVPSPHFVHRPPLRAFRCSGRCSTTSRSRCSTHTPRLQRRSGRRTRRVTR
eukprot:6203169-Pleurochrysis_carterae.AAC.1